MKNKELAEFVTLSAGYLAKHVQTSGKFVYRKHMNGDRVGKDYNVLRHAGSVYAMALSQPYWGKDLQPDVDRALAYLWSRFMVTIETEGKHCRVLVDGREGKSGSDVVKLGGLALAILALISQPRDLTTAERDIAKDLRDYLVSMVFEDGFTLSKYNIATNSAYDFRSLYYPGEAALALVMYGRKFGCEASFEVGVRILSYLADLRAEDEECPPDHWALIATSEALKCDAENVYPLIGKTRQDLYRHAVQIVEKMVQDAFEALDGSGALEARGSVCSTATRLEGLLAIWPWLKQFQYENFHVVQAYVEGGMDYVFGAQIKSGKLSGGLPWTSPHHSNFKSVKMSPQIRIDTVQHAMCAMMTALTLSQ